MVNTPAAHRRGNGSIRGLYVISERKSGFIKLINGNDREVKTRMERASCACAAEAG